MHCLTFVPRRSGTGALGQAWASILGGRADSPHLSAYGPVVLLAGGSGCCPAAATPPGCRPRSTPPTPDDGRLRRRARLSIPRRRAEPARGWAVTLEQAEAANAVDGLDRLRQSPFADPGYGTGFTGHGTMVMLHSVSPRPTIVHLKGGGPGASDNDSKLRPTQRDVPRQPRPARRHAPWGMNSSGISRAAPEHPRNPGNGTARYRHCADPQPGRPYPQKIAIRPVNLAQQVTGAR